MVERGNLLIFAIIYCVTDLRESGPDKKILGRHMVLEREGGGTGDCASSKYRNVGLIIKVLLLPFMTFVQIFLFF